MTDGKPIIWGDPTKDHRTLVLRDGSGVDREVTEGFEMYDVNERWMTIRGRVDGTRSQHLRVTYSSGLEDVFAVSMFRNLRWAWTAPRVDSDPGPGRLRQPCTDSACNRVLHAETRTISDLCSHEWDKFVAFDDRVGAAMLDLLHERAAAVNPVMRTADDGQRYVLCGPDSSPIIVGSFLTDHAGQRWAAWRGGRKGGYVLATADDEGPARSLQLPVPLHRFDGLMWATYELHRP